MQVAQHALLCFIRMFLSAASHFDGRNGFAAAGCWHDGVASFEEERLENDMKTAIVYVSTHHGNTKKLVDAIAAVKTDRNDRPLTEQKIASITVDTHGETYPEPNKLPDPYGRF